MKFNSHGPPPGGWYHTPAYVSNAPISVPFQLVFTQTAGKLVTLFSYWENGLQPVMLIQTAAVFMLRFNKQADIN